LRVLLNLKQKKKMKFLKITGVLFFVAFILNSCSNKSNPPAPPPADQPIAFTHNAGNNVQNPGANLNFTVTLSSAMPSGGIKVEVSTKEEATNNPVGTNSSVNSSSANVNMSIAGLPRQVWCIVTIKVSSVSTPSNSNTQIFRVVYK
jgi:hypothetical protein